MMKPKERQKTMALITRAGKWQVTAGAVLGLLTLFSSCDKELDIADFAAEYGDYEPELRIEAILDVVDPWSSVVRVDWTILVTDTSIFNSRDDDGDWDPLVDDVGEDGMAADNEFIEPDEGEGNGRPDQGEPHVDELDEILPQINDSTVAVVLNDYLTGELVMDFQWHPQADSVTIVTIESSGFVVGPEDMRFEVVTYGAYKPVVIYDTIDVNREYEFQITTSEHLITGTVQPLPPPVFDHTGHTIVGDTLYMPLGGLNPFTWTTAPEATVFWVLVEQVHRSDSIRTVTSHPAAPTEQDEQGNWIGHDILSLYLPGLYRWTVAVPSRAYGAYVYSQLPMRDEQVSNLRDENGQVVLGIAGSAAEATQYVRVLGSQYFTAQDRN
ncbi:MAG: hypothetical protein JSW54_12660 [Fidelibacterota bacterium]|nr:MAG: hypothetical protein JSW54_12660 [Candidatus Neomarinimicrobiota bacterium]